MISDLYHSDLTIRSKGTNQGRPIASNVTHVTQIYAWIDDGTTATDV